MCIVAKKLTTKDQFNNFNTIEFFEAKNGARKYKAASTDTVGNNRSEAFGFVIANKEGYRKNPALPGAIQNNHIHTHNRIRSYSAFTVKFSRATVIFNELTDLIVKLLSTPQLQQLIP